MSKYAVWIEIEEHHPERAGEVDEYLPLGPPEKLMVTDSLVQAERYVREARKLLDDELEDYGGPLPPGWVECNCGCGARAPREEAF